MGQLNPSSPDLADRAIIQQLSTVGAVTPWFDFVGTANLAVWATGGATGTVVLEKSFDGGTTALPATNLGEAVSFAAPCAELIFSRENGVLWRARRTAGSGATLFARLSQ
jgi:hypothetical protein